MDGAVGSVHSCALVLIRLPLALFATFQQIVRRCSFETCERLLLACDLRDRSIGDTVFLVKRASIPDVRFVALTKYRSGMNTARMLYKVGLILMLLVPVALRAQSCDGLLQLASSTMSVTFAVVVDAGHFAPVGSTDTFQGLPSFCRVAANLRPTPDSDVRVEVWLPPHIGKANSWP